ncbi:glutaminase [Escherichia coli]|nr:glutaminase [Escherichia coli]
MEQGIPRNPFINAGALVVCDMLQWAIKRTTATYAGSRAA